MIRTGTISRRKKTMERRIYDLDDMLPYDIESAVLSRQVPIINEHREYGRTKREFDKPPPPTPKPKRPIRFEMPRI